MTAGNKKVTKQEKFPGNDHAAYKSQAGAQGLDCQAKAPKEVWMAGPQSGGSRE